MQIEPVKYHRKKIKSSVKVVVNNYNVDFLVEKLAKVLPAIISSVIERELEKEILRLKS
ncbi:MAG: hypothetical protein WCK03_02695 [Candidatus Taylorbacteria bacterium]